MRIGAITCAYLALGSAGCQHRCDTCDGKVLYECTAAAAGPDAVDCERALGTGATCFDEPDAGMLAQCVPPMATTWADAEDFRWARWPAPPDQPDDYDKTAEVVTDRVTGLAWTRRAVTKKSWREADWHCRGLRHEDGTRPWRLPTEIEAHSLDRSVLVDFEPGWRTLWTATSFRRGESVHCVLRSQAALGEHYTLTDATVVDHWTRLEWRRDAGRNFNRADARAFCGSLGPGWRVPREKELFSIVRFPASLDESPPHVDGELFAEGAGTFRTETPVPPGVSTVDFQAAVNGPAAADGSLHSVRCVRSRSP